MISRIKYYDGKQAKSYNAIIKLKKDHLIIGLSSEGTITWYYKSIIILEKSEDPNSIILTYKPPPETRLIINDIDIYNNIIEKMSKRFFTVLSTAYPSLKTIVFWSICALILCIQFYLQLPKLVDYSTRNLPESWEEKLGTYTINIIANNKKICTNAKGVKALQKLTNVLSSSTEQKINVTVVIDKNINAFAAPGRKIIIFNELINAVDNQNELAGVIAHEMGHIIKHHPTSHIIQALGIHFLAEMIFNGTGTGSTPIMISNLLQLKYSRELEEEADRIAGEILYRNNLDNSGLVNFFKRAEIDTHEEKDNLKIFTYLSTHPDITDRITTIRRLNVSTPKQILTKEEWASLKAICKN